MEYLLDTHTLIWSVFEPDQLPPKVADIIAARHNKVYVSTVSLWEIAIKISIGKLNAEQFSIPKLIGFCKQLHFIVLDIKPQNAISYLSVPLFQNHRDPFDRMLIATAIERKFTLLSRDTKLPQYEDAGLSHLW